ncbi:hypothetical protein DXG03_005395, partial [Asterophora parasitica]
DAPDSDIAFVSSDGVTFKLHKKNLDLAAGAFPPPEFHTTEESVPLSEPSATLEILFQFLYPSQCPELDEYLSFDLLESLAEAAEKYQVFFAIIAARASMRKTLPLHADGIMVHALKHGYKDIIDLAAVPLLGFPFEKTVNMLPDHAVRAWGLRLPGPVSSAEITFSSRTEKHQDYVV